MDFTYNMFKEEIYFKESDWLLLKGLYNNHKIFGRGLIRNIDNTSNIIKVAFDDNRNEKQFMLNESIDNFFDYIEYNEDTILSNKRELLSLRLEERNITKLFHITNIRNLPGILRYGIYSITKLKELDIEYEFNDEQRLDNRPNYISVSISRINQKYFNNLQRKNDNTYCIIEIDPKIIINQNCLYFYTNAASRDFKYLGNNKLQNLSSFDHMFKDVVTYSVSRPDYDSGWFRTVIYKSERDENELLSNTTNDQAEIMINQSIDLNFIMKVIFKTNDDLKNYKLLLDERNVDYIVEESYFI